MTRATGIFHRFWSATGVISDFAGLFVRFSETELSECPSGNYSVKHFLVFVTKITNFPGLSTHPGAKNKARGLCGQTRTAWRERLRKSVNTLLLRDSYAAPAPASKSTLLRARSLPVCAGSRRGCVCVGAAISASLPRTHRNRCTRSRARATF